MSDETDRPRYLTWEERGRIEAAEAVAYKVEFTRIFGGEYMLRPPLPKPPRGVPVTPAPRCACCGKRYGQRNTHVETRIVTAAEGRPAPYSGNAMLLREELSLAGKRDGQPAARLVRETWDGTSWRTPYEPFCTLRCGLDFARAAHRAGYRITR